MSHNFEMAKALGANLSSDLLLDLKKHCSVADGGTFIELGHLLYLFFLSNPLGILS